MYIDNQTYTKSLILIKNKTGDTIFEREVEFPTHFNEQTRKIVSSRYFAKNETSLKQLVTRVCTVLEHKMIEQYGEKVKHLSSYGIDTAHDFGQYLYDNVMEQNFAFNTPVWGNLGVEGRNQQTSACFINSVEDNLESILELLKTEGKIYNGGSGSGVNMTPIRGEGESLTHGGTSSGMLSFLRGNDVSAGIIKSGGGLRRAAKMALVDEHHIDIVPFIECKTKAEELAEDLIGIGYDDDFNGDVYTKIIPFQNANHSVRLSDKTMQGHTVYLRDQHGGIVGKIGADEMLDLISENAWKTGEPGVQFMDTINKWHTCKNDGLINASNPCSEYFFLDDTACNLASINVLNMYYKPQKFIRLINVLTIALDLLVDFHYPTKKLEENNRKYRTIGLGITNFGALSMIDGHAYGDEGSESLITRIMKTLTYNAYLTSTRLAQLLGTFPRYEQNKEPMIKVVKEMFDLKDDDILFQSAAVFGFRNAQVSVIAPTGTISFMMGADTFGIEPLFSPTFEKTLSGGGKIPSQVFDCIKIAKEKHDLLDNDPILATSVGNNSIHYQKHLNIVGAAQRYVTGGISKTINLPESATPEDISKVFKTAWFMGIKSITVYRNRSKGIQPLNVVEEPQEVTNDDGMKDLLKEVTQIMVNTTNDRNLKNTSCRNCGSYNMTPNGTCKVCINCGLKTGC